MDIGVLIIRLKGIGCASCIAPSKIHLLSVHGVKGVHIRGSEVIVFYDHKTLTPEEILDKSKLRDYYKIVYMKAEVIDYKDMDKYIKKYTYRV
ncbi:hypothetical protein J4526_04335 [Desulfurococcaceae archaeon MEX13E-LK6-19]|nr:hypothetical protein J4526_04335 [Desulfurococcaceae archaeon MEX13E-LK6-19]